MAHRRVLTEAVRVMASSARFSAAAASSPIRRRYAEVLAAPASYHAYTVAEATFYQAPPAVVVTVRASSSSSSRPAPAASPSASAAAAGSGWRMFAFASLGATIGGAVVSAALLSDTKTGPGRRGGDGDLVFHCQEVASVGDNNRLLIREVAYNFPKFPKVNKEYLVKWYNYFLEQAIPWGKIAVNKIVNFVKEVIGYARSVISAVLVNIVLVIVPMRALNDAKEQLLAMQQRLGLSLVDQATDLSRGLADHDQRILRLEAAGAMRAKQEVPSEVLLKVKEILADEGNKIKGKEAMEAPAEEDEDITKGKDAVEVSAADEEGKK